MGVLSWYGHSCVPDGSALDQLGIFVIVLLFLSLFMYRFVVFFAANGLKTGGERRTGHLDTAAPSNDDDGGGGVSVAAARETTRPPLPKSCALRLTRSLGTVSLLISAHMLLACLLQSMRSHDDGTDDKVFPPRTIDGETAYKLYGIFVVLSICFEVVLKCYSRGLIVPYRNNLFLKLAALCGAVAIGFWVLDRFRVICNPDSEFQGHAVWHVFIAANSTCLCLYLGTETWIVAGWPACRDGAEEEDELVLHDGLQPERAMWEEWNVSAFVGSTRL